MVHAMKHPKLVMLGAGSGFTACVAVTLEHEALRDCTFALVDIDADRLQTAAKAVADIVRRKRLGVRVEATTRLETALEGCDYLIASCEINRNPF